MIKDIVEKEIKNENKEDLLDQAASLIYHTDPRLVALLLKNGTFVPFYYKHIVCGISQDSVLVARDINSLDTYTVCIATTDLAIIQIIK